MSSTRYSCHALPKLECSRHILKNTQISYFVRICPVGANIIPCRRTDRNDEANSRFSQFCESA